MVPYRFGYFRWCKYLFGSCEIEPWYFCLLHWKKRFIQSNKFAVAGGQLHMLSIINIIFNWINTVSLFSSCEIINSITFSEFNRQHMQLAARDRQFCWFNKFFFSACEFVDWNFSLRIWSTVAKASQTLRKCATVVFFFLSVKSFLGKVGQKFLTWSVGIKPFKIVATRITAPCILNFKLQRMEPSKFCLPDFDKSKRIVVSYVLRSYLFN